MAIISKDSFEKFTEEEKNLIRKDYKDLLSDDGEWTEELTPEERSGVLTQMKFLFDEESLQHKSAIKVWGDVMYNLTETEKDEVETLLGDICFGPFMNHGSSSICKKMIAAYKISILIEDGYGGLPTDEEWKETINKGNSFYTIVWNPLYKSLHIKCEGSCKSFIAFHTKQQAEEFIAYESNRTLVEHYYMI